jgi:hypothetical protein
MEILAPMADLGVKLRLSNHLLGVPKMAVAEPWLPWSRELTPILHRLMLGRKRAVFVMYRNHQHLGPGILIKIPHLRNNGKTQILSSQLHTGKEMIPRKANRTTHGGTTGILDGAEHRMVLLASQGLVDFDTRHIMHNERTFTSLLYSAGR